MLLESLFEAAGVDPSDRDTRTKVAQPFRSAYVLVEAADGYQVVFSIPEVFSRFGGSGILLADRQDGAQLAAKAAPYQVVVPRSPEHERWARQVTRILMQRASASPFPAAAPVGGTEARGHAGGVFVVGTGPGAPDLITVRAAELLKRADHVFCFSWMKDELSPMVREGVVEVASPLLRGGQLCGQDPVTGDPELRGRVIETNEELSRLRARIKDLVEGGKTVVFADNGDPMIFSPWSWVPQHLAEFSPVIVPGLSSFNAANAALKRGVAGLGSVLLSSGSEIGHPDSTGRLSGTVVFFTHLKKLDALLPTLQERYPQDTPIAIVCDVSYPAEKVIEGTLGTIRDRLSKQPPLPHLYLVYVGDGLKHPRAAISSRRAAVVPCGVHEKTNLEEGWAAERTLFAANEFLLVGPPADPAAIARATTVVDAYQRIAKSRATFLSRGDNSGTHRRELALWRQAGLHPSGPCYQSDPHLHAGRPRRAAEQQAYFMTDSSTWVTIQEKCPSLQVLFRGDPQLVNVYHALCQGPRTAGGSESAAQFVACLASHQAQSIVRDFGRRQYGTPLYMDARTALVRTP